MTVTEEERVLLQPMYEVYALVDPSLSQDEIKQGVDTIVNNVHFTSNPFENDNVTKDFQDNMLPSSRMVINPHGVDKEQSASWFVSLFTGRCQVLGQNAPPAPAMKCNFLLQESIPLPKDGGKFGMGANGGLVATLTSFLAGVGASILIGAVTGFLTVVLKRAFPLHHVQIERMIKYIKITVSIVGIIGIIAMFFSAGIAAIPVIIILAIVSLFAAYLAEQISMKVTEFLCDLKETVFNWLSDLAERANLPNGVIDFLRSRYSPTMRVHVGLCTMCNEHPRNAISTNCGHMVFCKNCQEKATHCVCGEVMSNMVCLFADPDMIECDCKGCVPVMFCGSCGGEKEFDNKVATVFHVYKNKKMSLRCKDCIDKTAKLQIYVPHHKKVCEPVVIPENKSSEQSS